MGNEARLPTGAAPAGERRRMEPTIAAPRTEPWPVPHYSVIVVKIDRLQPAMLLTRHRTRSTVTLRLRFGLKMLRTRGIRRAGFLGNGLAAGICLTVRRLINRAEPLRMRWGNLPYSLGYAVGVACAGTTRT
jgi:hypothetical protein